MLFFVGMRVSFSRRVVARLAQSAERKTLNLVVVGSSPTSGASADSVSASAISGLRPAALLSEHRHPEVASSILARGTSPALVAQLVRASVS